MKPMTDRQKHNVLYWVQALLSGYYKHGKHKMYDPQTDCYCAMGVALAEFNLGRKGFREIDRVFLDPKEHGWLSANQWFEVTFGLPRNATLYSTMNDMSNDYLAVCSLLLHAVPDDFPYKAPVYKRFMEKCNEAHKARV